MATLQDSGGDQARDNGEQGTKREASWDPGTNAAKNPRLPDADSSFVAWTDPMLTGATMPAAGMPFTMPGQIGLPTLGAAMPNLAMALAPGQAAMMPGLVAQTSGKHVPPVNGMTPVTATWIPTERIGDVLGVRGAIIQRIKQISGAHQVHLQEEVGRPTTPVQVAGPPEAVTKVGELVQAVLAGRHEEIGYVREVVEFPDKLKAPSAGPVGHMLKRVSAVSGAWVQQPDVNGPLVVTGNREAVTKALAAIKDEAGEGAPAIAPAANTIQLPGAAALAGMLPATGPASQPAASAPAVATAPAAEQDDVARRQQLLDQLRSHLEVSGASAGGSSSQPANPNQILTATFEIPASKVKDVLGVRGRNVKAIKSQSGIQKIGLMDRSDPATVTVTGTPSAIEACRFMVLAIASGDQSVIGNCVEQIEINQNMVSKFIGPKGQVITNIKEQSGAYIEVREIGTGNSPRIILTGPPDSVVRAKELISNFLLDQGNSQTAVAPGLPIGLLAGAAPAAPAFAADPYAQLILQAQLQAQLQEAQLQAFASAQLQALLPTQQPAAAPVAAAVAPGALPSVLDLQALYGQLAPQPMAVQAVQAQPLAVQQSLLPATAMPQQPLPIVQMPQTAVGIPAAQVSSATQMDQGALNLLKSLEALQAQQAQQTGPAPL